MTTVNQGAELVLDLGPNDAYRVTVADGGDAYVDLVSGAPGSPTSSPRLRAPTTSRVFGPYGVSARIRVRSIAGITDVANFRPSSPVVTNTETGAPEDLKGSPVSADGILPRADTQFPAERVSMSATGGVCGAPCQIERIRCVTGTSVALTVYEGAASTTTTLLTATLSAGEEASIATPIRAINGVRAVFASGSFDFYISQEV